MLTTIAITLWGAWVRALIFGVCADPFSEAIISKILT